MHHPVYVQIFSITDHTKPLHGRYEGQYHGTNAELQTSDVENGKLRIATQTKVEHGVVSEKYFQGSKVILAYRHSDTGILNGTSETLFSISESPWEKMPGLVFTISPNNAFSVRFWSQEMRPEIDDVYRIHFGKTLVYLKNFGPLPWVFTGDVLVDGPAQLHSKKVDHNIFIAPETGSGIQVKMGQETQNS